MYENLLSTEAAPHSFGKKIIFKVPGDLPGKYSCPFAVFTKFRFHAHSEKRGCFFIQTY